MSKFFEMAKRNYERGFWSIEMLRTFTALGRITAAEYKEITGRRVHACDLKKHGREKVKRAM